MPIKAAVILFPGSNRERDAARALEKVSKAKAQIIWHGESTLPSGTDLVVLPGGFSYGDYLRCGAMAARSPIMGAVKAHAEKGGLVLGICNGFQILCESGLLPGVLMRNQFLKFHCKQVHLRVEHQNSPFTHTYAAHQVLQIPCAHGEGNYRADDETIKRLEGEGLVAFRYCSPDGQLTPEANPNGSLNHIAGIFSEKRNVLGLMPHPENAIEALNATTDGAGLFESLANLQSIAA